MDGLKDNLNSNVLQFSYDNAYDEVYQTTYNASFVFSDEDSDVIDYYDIDTFDLPLAPAGFGARSDWRDIRYKVFQVIIAEA